MLNPSERFTLREVPQVIVYPDHATPSRFYAIPVAPRVALDEQGKPLINLLIYGRRQGSEVRPMGGQIMVTTDLALAPAEREALVRALSKRLISQIAPGEAQRENPTPEVVSPDWIEGEVVVRLSDAIQLSGRPSMMGANQCAMSLNLIADQVPVLQKAWSDGLLHASITYRAQATAASQSTTAMGQATTEEAAAPGRVSRVSSVRAVHADLIQSARLPMMLEGPLRLSKDVLKTRVQVVLL